MRQVETAASGALATAQRDSYLRINVLSTTDRYAPFIYRSLEIGTRMARRITWNGTNDEALALLHALKVHCECRIEASRIVSPCASHHMLTRDQRAVDGLLFMRRIAARLLAEEFDLALPATVGR